jgi:hypothetical protein
MSKNTKILPRWVLALPLIIMFSGCMATEADTVSDPKVEFPSWSTDHNQTQSVKVTPPAGWTVSRVDYSLDGTNWMQAKPTDPPTDSYSIELTNLDIGSNDLTLRVTSSYREQTSTTIFHSAINGVAAQFDCNTPAASMLPSATMIYQDGTEFRTLKGYFGDPLRGHSVVATIDFTNDGGSSYQIEGAINSYGRTEITVSFQVGHATCTQPRATGFQCTGPCSVSYGLTVSVDGTQLCQNTGFGNVTNLCPG